MIVGCGKNESKKSRDQDGPLPTVDLASKADFEYLNKVWGVRSPATNAYLASKADDLMVLMVPHEQLDPYEKSIQRNWQPVNPGTVIRHKDFVVDGSSDTKARFTKWKGEDGKIRYIVLDYSTGVVSYFNLAE